MIRVEITEWNREEGARTPDPNHPEARPAEPHWKRAKTLLLQDFDGLNLENVIALLNNLEPEPLCTCGHPAHVGDCSVGPGYGGCRCNRYESQAQKDHREVVEKLRDKIHDGANEYGKLEARVQVQTGRLERQDGELARIDTKLTRMTRSRDRLRTTQATKRKR